MLRGDVGVGTVTALHGMMAKPEL